MDLGREKDFQGVQCLCTQHNSRGNCLLRSFSLTHFNLDCQTTDNINIWWLLIAQVKTYTPASGDGTSCVLFLFRSIHICNNYMLQGLFIDMREMCSQTMRQIYLRPQRTTPLCVELGLQLQSKHSFSLALLIGTKTSFD